jgi:P4 family phage/plasmid primase-like protien
LRKNLQEFLGLVFINRNKAKVETMMWLHGNGANGKSVIFNTIMGVLGSSNISNYDIFDLTASMNKERNVAKINGKLLNYCSDVDSKTIMNDSIKALISGEPMVARPMYQDSFTVYDIPLMMGNTNRVPYFKETSDAWLRRIRPIPFEITIPEEKQDKKLSDKLTREFSGILNWILVGRERIIKQNFHFTPSSRIEAFLRSYKNMGNTVKQFEDFLGISPSPKKAFDAGKTISAEKLYFKYRAWAELVKTRVGEMKVTDKSFYNAFSQLGYLKQRGPTGSVFRYFGNVTIDEFEV